MMELSDVQRSVLSMVFRIADDRGLLLLDLKDLRLMLQYVGDNADTFTLSFGNVSKATIGTIQRSLALLQDQGADIFFGEPGFLISDWIRTDEKGRGYINILTAATLFSSPLLYSTFLLWLLSELFETMPEVGDLEKPKMVFFFDEAHLLFRDAPPFLLDRVDQVIRLIRSKGVGVYFVTQSPSDIPDGILAQLGNRVQHALRAYTPAEQKKIRAAAQAFRTNPAFDTETVLTELGVGEALVSFLDEKGIPGIVERALILPPQSFIGPAGEVNITAHIEGSPIFGKYEKALDRESAYEMLMEKYQKDQKDNSAGTSETTDNAGKSVSNKPVKKSAAEKAVTSALNSAGREIGRSLVRGLLGSFLK
jgi:DNA helicase HerA-like ATPase